MCWCWPPYLSLGPGEVTSSASCSSSPQTSILTYVGCARFPLLLHYLEQTNINQVELEQWQDWLLALDLNSVQVVASEAWSLDLITALVDQLPLYNSISKEKSFCVILTGPVLILVTQKQHVLDTDTLSLLFLVSVNRSLGPYMIGPITTQCFDPRAGPEECCG